MSQKFEDSHFNKKIMFFLVGICIIGIIIRLYYTPNNIPLNLDAFTGYFWYAMDISILGHLPNYTLSQSGWGEFLSLFFTNFHSDRLMDYMNLQRIVSVIVSGLTIIPVYFICRKYFSEYFSLLGAVIFAFEPRIIINSTLGISEPLYIFVISLGVLFFLNSNKIISYVSFGFFAWATIIRPEGQFWFLAFAIIYFVRFRKNPKDLIKFVIPVVIFLIVLSPFVYHRILCCDNDAIIGRVLIEISNYNTSQNESYEQANTVYGPNWISGIKLFGWSLIPIFIVFIPLGIIQIFRNFRYPNNLLIISSAVLSLPILYSTSIAPDTRYVFALFPIFIVISLFGIKWISDIFKSKRMILAIITIAIISSSVIFLDIKKIDYEENVEAFEITRLLPTDLKGVNEGSKIIQYLPIVELEKKWPIKETTGQYMKEYEVKIIPISKYNSLNELISFEKSNITHLIIDENGNNPEYILDIIKNEANYPFLVKEFDSKQFDFKYRVKVYKIDYNIFREMSS